MSPAIVWKSCYCVWERETGRERGCRFVHSSFRPKSALTDEQNQLSKVSRTWVLVMCSSWGGSVGLSEISQQLSHGLPWCFLQSFMMLRGFILQTIVIPDFFSGITIRSKVILWNISCTTWVGTTFCTGIHCSQVTYSAEFGDSMTFPLAPPWGRHLCFLLNCLTNC